MGQGCSARWPLNKGVRCKREAGHPPPHRHQWANTRGELRVSEWTDDSNVTTVTGEVIPDA